MTDEIPQSELHLRAFTYLQRTSILPELGVAIDNAGGWVLERRTLSADMLELAVEVGLSALSDVYAALVSAGLELTRESHRAITQQVTCGLHMRPRRTVSSILLLLVEMQFLDPPPQPLDLLQRFPQTCARA